jgi:DNA-binding Lrp family transcriptional regulator
MSTERDTVLDETDREVLEVLNQNSSLGADSVATQLGISRSNAEERISRLEDDIMERFAVIDPRKVGLTVPGYAFAQCEETYDTAIDQSLQFVKEHEGVQSIGTVYGEYDIIIRKLSTDLYKLNNFSTNGISYSTAQKTCATTELIRWHGIDVASDEWETHTDIAENIDDTSEAVLEALQKDPTLRSDQMALAHHIDSELDDVSGAIRQLEQQDVILGYSIRLNLDQLGWGRVYLGISTLSDLPPTNDQQQSQSNYQQVRSNLQKEYKKDDIRKDNLHIPFVGSGLGESKADIFAEVVFESMEHLDKLTDEIREMDGVKTTRTYIEADRKHEDYHVRNP